LRTVGDQFVLGVRTIQHLFIDLFTGQFQWQEFIRQGAFMAGTAVVPTVLVALPIGVTLSVQFALLAGQVGATSLAGAASGLAVIRQAASLTAAILMAAAVGSAITADLGSRTMREETDAMEVMGVSVIRRLVVPRFAAAIMIGVALTGVVCFVGFLASFLFNVYFQNGAPGSFVATFRLVRHHRRHGRRPGEGGDLRRDRGRGGLSEGTVHRRRADRCRQLGERGGGRVDPAVDDRQRRDQPALHHDVPEGRSLIWPQHNSSRRS
jgi:phospholipid/cholesterol/gamma-HCH transport system permease protein